MRIAELLLVAGMLSLCGCGGGGGGVSTAPAPPSATVRGSVSPDYGTGPLTVISAWATAGQPVQAGQFTTDISTQSAFTLFAVDQASAPHALTISVPGGSPNFTVASTAATLVFMSPGIYSHDPSKAISTLQAIQAMGSFPALVSALGAQGSGSLLAALSNSTTRQAFLNCLAEWFTAHPFMRRETRGITTDSSGIQDLIPFGTLPSAVSNTDINVQNAGFRVLEVYEKRYPCDGSATSVARLSDLSGATGVSLLDAILQQVGEPAVQDYRVDFSSAGSYRAEFFFRGLGALSSNVQAPSDVAALFPTVSSADVKTIYWYVVSPILDSVSGFADFLNYKSNWLQLIDAASNSTAVIDALQNLKSAIGSGDSASISLAAAEAAQAVWDATKDLIKPMLVSYFKSLGNSALDAGLKATVSSLAMDAAIAVAVTVDGFALFQFVSDVKNDHTLNLGVAQSDGSGVVGVN